MPALDVNFAGLKLENPIVAASAPPTETLANIIHCAEAGVGAVITKTCADFESNRFPRGGRRVYLDGRGVWATGSFRRETVPLEAGVQLVKEAVKRVNIPIIASVGALDLERSHWADVCLRMQDAGASMLQLDLFYLPQPRCSAENAGRLRDLLGYISSRLSIPIAPKLNIDLPAHFSAQVLKDTGVAAVLAMDSIRTPLPLDIDRRGRSRMAHLAGARDCSLFGAWQKPLTLQYIAVLSREFPLPLGAGGGLENAQDAIEAMMLGATTVHFASAIIRHGYREISKIKQQMMLFLEKHPEYDHRIANLVGVAHAPQRSESPEVYLPARAKVDPGKCTRCGACTRLIFCEDLHLDASGQVMVEATCDGCGYCVQICPTPGALRLLEVG